MEDYPDDSIEVFPDDAAFGDIDLPGVSTLASEDIEVLPGAAAFGTINLPGMETLASEKVGSSQGSWSLDDDASLTDNGFDASRGDRGSSGDRFDDAIAAAGLDAPVSAPEMPADLASRLAAYRARPRRGTVHVPPTSPTGPESAYSRSPALAGLFDEQKVAAVRLAVTSTQSVTRPSAHGSESRAPFETSPALGALVDEQRHLEVRRMLTDIAQPARSHKAVNEGIFSVLPKHSAAVQNLIKWWFRWWFQGTNPSGHSGIANQLHMALLATKASPRQNMLTNRNARERIDDVLHSPHLSAAMWPVLHAMGQSGLLDPVPARPALPDSVDLRSLSALLLAMGPDAIPTRD